MAVTDAVRWNERRAGSVDASGGEECRAARWRPGCNPFYRSVAAVEVTVDLVEMPSPNAAGAFRQSTACALGWFF